MPSNGCLDTSSCGTENLSRHKPQYKRDWWSFSLCILVYDCKTDVLLLAIVPFDLYLFLKRIQWNAPFDRELKLYLNTESIMLLALPPELLPFSIA